MMTMYVMMMMMATTRASSRGKQANPHILTVSAKEPVNTI
jgi:hypothetical protein